MELGAFHISAYAEVISHAMSATPDLVLEQAIRFVVHRLYGAFDVLGVDGMVKIAVLSSARVVLSAWPHVSQTVSGPLVSAVRSGIVGVARWRLGCPLISGAAGPLSALGLLLLGSLPLLGLLLLRSV